MPGLGISIEETKSKTISETYSTAKGEKAEYSLYQLVETYYFYKNGSVSRTVKNETNTISKIVKGWSWKE